MKNAINSRKAFRWHHEFQKCQVRIRELRIKPPSTATWQTFTLIALKASQMAKMIQWETNPISRHCLGRLNLVPKNLCLYFSEWIAFSSTIHTMFWWWPKTVGASWAQLMWLRRRMSKSLMPIFARTQNLSLHLFRMGYRKIWLWVEVQKKNSKKLWDSALMASMNPRRNR